MKKKSLITGIIILLAISAIFLFQFKDYIPFDNQFSRTGNMTMPREGHKAVLLKDGRVLILGGATCEKRMWVGKMQTMCGNTTNTAEVYDSKLGRFSLLADKMHNRNNEFTATLLKDGKVLIVGSYDAPDINNSELFDPKTNKLEDTAPLNIQRAENFTATLMQDGRVLVVGGLKEKFEGLKSTIVKEAEIYDPKTGKFTLTGSLNTPRFEHDAILLNDGKVLIVGGMTKNKYLSSAELYDPKTGKFTSLGNMSFLRTKPKLTKLKDGRILIADGYKFRSCSSNIELYDPAKNTFKASGKPIGISECTSNITLLQNGNVLFVGGTPPIKGVAQNFGSSNIYNPESDKFEIGPKTKVPHASHTLTLLNNGKVLAIGGRKYSGIENRAEVYNYKK